MPSPRDDDLADHIEAILAQYNEVLEKWKQLPRVYEEQLDELRRARDRPADTPTQPRPDQ